MENNDGLDGGERTMEHSCERQCQDTGLKWESRKVGLQEEKMEDREGEDVDEAVECVVVKRDSEMEKGGIG